MKPILTMILLIGSSKEELIEPSKENCFYDCKNLYYSEMCQCYTVECFYNQSYIQVCVDRLDKRMQVRCHNQCD